MLKILSQFVPLYIGIDIRRASETSKRDAETVKTRTRKSLGHILQYIWTGSSLLFVRCLMHDICPTFCVRHAKLSSRRAHVAQLRTWEMRNEKITINKSHTFSASSHHRSSCSSASSRSQNPVLIQLVNKHTFSNTISNVNTVSTWNLCCRPKMWNSARWDSVSDLGKISAGSAGIPLLQSLFAGRQNRGAGCSCAFCVLLLISNLKMLIVLSLQGRARL